MKETFEQVTEKIKIERDYQDTCVSKYFAYHGKDAALDSSRSIPAEILMMDHYLHEAQAAWTHDASDTETLDKIRKVAAMAIRCLQHHGCPERGLDDSGYVI